MEKARKARAEKAIKLAEERMESPPQPKNIHLSPMPVVDGEELSENGHAFINIVEDFERSVRAHEVRESGDPGDVTVKEHDFRFLKEVLLSFRHVIF